MAAPQMKHTVELERHALNGWAALALVVLWFIAVVAVFLSAGPNEDSVNEPVRVLYALLMLPVGIFWCFGFFTLEPNA